MNKPASQPDATERSSDFYPACVRELRPAPDVVTAFQAFSQRPGCLLFDSAMQLQSAAGQPLGRYSFLMADPFEWHIVPAGQVKPLDHIQATLKKRRCPTLPDLPPMQGGWAGLLSYDLNRSFEAIPAAAADEFQIPAVALGCYDVVVAWDHLQNRAWVVSQGFPETDDKSRHERAKLRLAEAMEWPEEKANERATDDALTPALSQREREHIGGTFSQRERKQVGGLSSKKNSLAQQFPARGPVGLTSNFREDQFVDAVARAIEYIYAGDVFQINLAQQLRYPATSSSGELYARLRHCNPAPFAGFFNFPLHSRPDSATAQIISASPERLVSVRESVVETRPIKGTRRRTKNPLVDIEARRELLASEKDRAENTMIVDLMRNDLSRVCTDDSIAVSQLCELETYQSVFHLVSAVTGRLKTDVDAIDLIQAVFPGGSITGAPKVRAMEIIAELEPTTRGAYCGSLGYFGFDGNADTNILIRTVTACDGWWQIPVGGGIVAQSDPKREYEETWTKAASMLRAIDQNP